MNLPDENFRPDWAPFWVDPIRPRPLVSPRALNTTAGISDRLRTAAFAELQAREAFLWAAKTFTDAPDELKKAWVGLAEQEDKHLGWLIKRNEEIGVPITDRSVSDHLWDSFLICKNSKQFSTFMASAEERGRVAGERFFRDLMPIDPVTAKIFGQIALEEQSHIDLALKFFPDIILRTPRK